MSTEVPRALLAVRYYQAAQEYLRNLPPEHFMEATPQAYQREITLASLALVHARWPKVQYFNELLVQYDRKGTDEPGQVVPDNMVVLHDQPIEAEGSYDVPLQPVAPFWVLEYVSKSNRRKDYEDSMHKYEHELKVPYYLLFVPEEQELTLDRHTGKKYVSVKPNEADRYTIPELKMELGLVDGWVRFWFRGELLPLPSELQRDVEQLRHQLKEEKRRFQKERKARLAAEQELARLREQLGRREEPRGS
jgi:Uma2 family endonuclease